MTVLGRAGCLSSLILGFGAALAAGCGGDSSTPPAPAPQPLVILHTNDLHSHLMGQSPEVDYTPATIGDDELDWTPGGLAAILQAATAAGATVPIVASNMNFSPTDPGDDGLQQLATAGVIQTKLIKPAGAPTITGIDTPLGGTGLTYRPPVVETAADLAMPFFAEAPVGNLVADAN